MTPREFLRAVWADEGFYCIARQKQLGSTDKFYWKHNVFATLDKVEAFVAASAQTEDIYFAIFKLADQQVWDPDKLNYRTGERGAFAVRKQSNMLCSKCFFFDIDVGEDKAYKTKQAAIAALKEFVEEAQLPWPTVVSSGRGFHVYWLLETAIPAADWEAPAKQLKALAHHYGLGIDNSRTTDVASVLRVPGTVNFKDRPTLHSVEIIRDGVISPVSNMLKMLSDASIRIGSPQETLVKSHSGGSLLGDNTSRQFEGEPPEIKAVATACKQVREMIRSKGDLPEPAWYHGLLNTIKWVKDGRTWAHRVSSGYPSYSAVETEAKLVQLDRYAPSTCETIASVMPDGEKNCEGCPFRNDPSVPNPMVAARRTTKAPPPVVASVEINSGAITLPDPPSPYTRLEAGGIALKHKNKDGDDTIEVIYPYDLYPIRRITDTESCVEQQLWCVDLPREGKKEFLLDAHALYDSRKFMEVVAHQGIYPVKSNLPYLQDYMVAYINELQRLADAEARHNHLGWSDDFESFILPDKVIHNDGRVTSSSLGLKAKRATPGVRKAGSLDEQLRLLRFYDDSRYVASQFMILAAIGTPLFFATGHNGVVVNASGESGASKSTTLAAAASVWGSPGDDFIINGTNKGATEIARDGRIEVLSNLPVCADEITHMSVRAVNDLVMNITQSGHRLRLQRNGVERTGPGGHKATIMLSTANSSLHGLLSTDNTAGTAGSMRVFEILFRQTKVHNKVDADKFLREIKRNYGWVGEQFVTFVVRNKAACEARVHAVQEQLDREEHIAPHERFWSAPMAVALVANEICKALGLVSYDSAVLRQWFAGQVMSMRGVVRDEYSSPLSVLTDFIQHNNGNILVVTQTKAFNSPHGEAYAQNQPHGAIIGHFDVQNSMLYILKKSFKDYCTRIGANSLQILDTLHQSDATGERVVTFKNIRKTLGAGTTYAKSQSWCIAVNMAHKEIVDQDDMPLINNGRPKLTLVT